MKKRKTLKTYLGKSKKTLSCCDKACKVLASQGFHNVFTFMALNERAASSCRGGLEENESTGLRLGTGAPTVPGPADWVLEWVWDADTSTGASGVAGRIPGGGRGLEDVENGSKCECTRCSPIRFDLGDFGLSGHMLDVNTNTDGVGDTPGGGGGLEDIENETEHKHIRRSAIGFDPGDFGSSGRILDVDTNTYAVGDTPDGGGGLEDLENENKCECVGRLLIQSDLGDFGLYGHMLDVDRKSVV